MNIALGETYIKVKKRNALLEADLAAAVARSEVVSSLPSRLLALALGVRHLAFLKEARSIMRLVDACM